MMFNQMIRFENRGNYLESEAGSRDTLKDLFINNINDIVEYLILLIDKTSFWIACLGCIYNIWLYVATHNKKYSSRVTVLILTYIFVQMIVCEVR